MLNLDLECQIPVISKIGKTFFCKNTKNNGIGMIKKKNKKEKLIW